MTKYWPITTTISFFTAWFASFVAVSLYSEKLGVPIIDYASPTDYLSLTLKLHSVSFLILFSLLLLSFFLITPKFLKFIFKFKGKISPWLHLLILLLSSFISLVSIFLLFNLIYKLEGLENGKQLFARHAVHLKSGETFNCLSTLMSTSDYHIFWNYQKETYIAVNRSSIVYIEEIVKPFEPNSVSLFNGVPPFSPRHPAQKLWLDFKNEKCPLHTK